jgi:hypothetical protein
MKPSKHVFSVYYTPFRFLIDLLRNEFANQKSEIDGNNKMLIQDSTIQMECLAISIFYISITISIPRSENLTGR